MSNRLTFTPSGSPVVTAEMLRLPTKDELASNLAKLFIAFPDQNRPHAEQVAAVYALALQGCSARAIKEGIRKVISGDVNGIDRWLPSTAMVARVVRAEDEIVKARLELKWGRRVSGWRAIGHWEEAWGPEPFKPGCECPDFMLADDFKPQDSLRLLEKLA